MQLVRYGKSSFQHLIFGTLILLLKYDYYLWILLFWNGNLCVSKHLHEKCSTKIFIYLKKINYYLLLAFYTLQDLQSCKPWKYGCFISVQLRSIVYSASVLFSKIVTNLYHHYHQFVPVVSSLPLIYSRLLFGFLEDSWKSNFQTFHFKQVLHLINIAATLNVMNKNLDLLWSIKLYEHINITDS